MVKFKLDPDKLDDLSSDEVQQIEEFVRDAFKDSKEKIEGDQNLEELRKSLQNTEVEKFFFDLDLTPEQVAIYKVQLYEYLMEVVDYRLADVIPDEFFSKLDIAAEKEEFTEEEVIIIVFSVYELITKEPILVFVRNQTRFILGEFKKAHEKEQDILQKIKNIPDDQRDELYKHLQEENFEAVDSILGVSPAQVK